ncbi:MULTISPECIES: alpha/beta hydrolase [Sphingobacterium]|uniref:Alpha/beta hydrolase family protein DUF900 n=1 Tax=Sphingobacterium detergens TaxID=1145106 RepID=A0A420BLP3_SPHD1|nr:MULTISPECIES: alpha/beta hydrolase [Sphingobacterium]MCS4227248.1 hypothetical protein [Sphingobacterium sp. BIGb0165]RKE57525.1 alpha/beta hydrolase family protein DUF900 [Sphingobacterium detergens]
MRGQLFYLFLLFSMVSCDIAHNVPKDPYPNSFDKPNIVNSFVDQNGNFYPDNWRKTYGEPPKSGDVNAYSLMKIATEKGIESQLKGFEKTRMLAVGSKVKAKDRVFIFVHGFNAPSDEVNESYEYMRKLLKLNTNKDEVVKFYWDGLHTTNPFGGAKVWFSATSFSQMAGEFGLRNLLNSISNKKIILISHSRGASVVLSALSSATFSTSFAKGTLENHNVDVDGAKKLAENGNDIMCIMLAPAIGIEDFKSKDVEKGTDSYRTFSKQVKKIHITVNNTDVMLKKFVGFLSNKLKATDLGYKVDVYNELVKYYPFMQYTDFTGMKSHDFNKYIRNPKFKGMLKADGIAVTR